MTLVPEKRGRPVPAWLGLAIVLVFNLWWRCHTIGPSIREWTGLNLDPVVGSESEPLDCDEAIYAYIGKRIAGGAVMYRDLTENKPPLGYWLFALAVKIGGANEATIRLMPIPIVSATIGLIWWLGARLRGPGTALIAALIYSLVSTDPYLYGDGDPMEHMVNIFATASVAIVAVFWHQPGRLSLIAAGACLGAATLVKQVAALNGVVLAAALVLRQTQVPRARLRDVSALTLGFLAICGLAVLVVIVQGAGREGFDDVFRYGRALATDLPRDPLAPPWFLRWLTGNADPSGKLPAPFGQSAYLVWWGRGSWPFWLASVPGIAWLLSGDGRRRLLAAWTLSAWIQVALPGLYWPHYYLLAVPGSALAIALTLADWTAAARARRWLPGAGAVALSLALVWTAKIQILEYLQTTPDELSTRCKGGDQWVVLRGMGRELGRRSTVWKKPTLFVWGWQSPLFFYSGLNGVTRQVFADDLIKTFARENHAIVGARIARTMRELRANPPSMILTGYPPFPELDAFLKEGYLPSTLSMSAPDGRGLWIDREHYGAFETLGGTIRERTPRPDGSRR